MRLRCAVDDRAQVLVQTASARLDGVHQLNTLVEYGHLALWLDTKDMIHL